MSWTHILLILVVALLVLGPNKLPEIAKGLGKGIREFKRAMNSLDDDEPPRRASYAPEADQAKPGPPGPAYPAQTEARPPGPAAIPAPPDAAPAPAPQAETAASKGDAPA